MKKIILLIAIFVSIKTKAQLFTEVSDSVGLNYVYPGISNLQIGGGVTVFDFDNDGWDDIFQAGGLFKSILWKNEKGKFKAVNDKHDLAALNGMYVNGSVAGDINNDGFEDLFVYNYSEGQGHGDRKPPVLFLNKNGKFSKCETCNFDGLGFFTSASMGDFNQDGFLDIYLTNYVKSMSLLEDSNQRSIGYNPIGLPNKFFVNNGNETFAEKAAFYQVNDNGCGLACAFSDYDNDGDLDLFLANDFGNWNKKGNQLFSNESSFHFLQNKSKEIHFYKEMYGMSIAPGDYDNDGDLDYFISNIGKNSLLKNNLKDGFCEVVDSVGLGGVMVVDSLTGTSWSGLFFDYDSDGDLDLYIAKGNVENYIPKAVVLDPNQLFENTGDGRFIENKKNSGVDCPLSHRGAATIDFDNDGDLDIVSSPVKIGYGAFGNYSQKIKLYRNNQNTKNWIKLIVEDDINHTSPIGAHVFLTANNTTQMREIDGGGAHASQSSKTIYFGLGKENIAKKITLKWKNNSPIYFENIAANNTYKVFLSGKILKLKK